MNWRHRVVAVVAPQQTLWLLRWQRFTPRERRLIVLGGGVLLLLLLYGAIISPWQQRMARLRQEVSQSQQTLAQLQQMAAALARYPAAPDARTDASLLSVVDQSVAAAGLGEALTRLELDSDGNRALLQLREVAFDALLSWLIDLEQRHGIQVLTATINRQRPNRVDAQLRLGRGG